MSHAMILGIVLVVGVLVIGGLLLLVRKRTQRKRTLDTVHYTKRWKALQKHCATRKTWPKAIIDADDLLNEALKQSNYRGKTTGERLVAAQHTLTANEDVWFSHKMRDTVVHEDVRRLKKQDIVDALGGFRQALKDLGALEP